MWKSISAGDVGDNGLRSSIGWDTTNAKQNEGTIKEKRESKMKRTHYYVNGHLSETD